MKRIIIIFLFIVIAGGFILGYYMYNKPHVNVSEEKIDLTTSVDALVNDFQTDQELAVRKYADKIVLLSGQFHSSSQQKNHIKTIILSGSHNLANCEMDTLYSDKIPAFSEGDEISLKGLFVGYDDLLGELQLKKCLVIK
jgi:hypothetical protein